MKAPTPAPRVSVIIPALDAAATLPLQLDALASQTYPGPWEVVVADNGSTDGTPELARRWGGRLPAITVVDASDGRGANHARNAGATAARGDVLAFCDADDEADAHWVEAMAEAAGTCAVVAGRLEVERLNDRLTRSWRVPPPGDGPRTAYRFLPAAESANLAVQTRVFRALGGFDKGFVRPGGDDTDFCWRAQLGGNRLCFASAAMMHYRYRPGLRALARQFYGYGLAGPRLFRRFHGRGMPRSRARGTLAAWALVLLGLPVLGWTRRGQGVWVREAAYRWGRLVGSVRNGVVFP